MASLIEVRRVRCHERYLRLRRFSGKIKRSLFNSNMDRIWNKIKGWRSILQAIPAYSMSLFKLPKGLLGEIHNLCNQFWWGSIQTNKKMHWASQAKLCKVNEDRGMGYHNLIAFNRAMLAKQGWRLEKNPNSFTARVLKSFYYPSSSFLRLRLQVGD